MKKLVFVVVHLLFTISIVISQQNEVETVVQTGHYAEITAVAYSNNGKFIVTGSVDKKVILWDAIKFKEVRTFLGCTDNVSHLEFSNNDTLLLAIDRSGVSRVWKVNTSEQILTVTLDDDKITHASFSPDNKLIVTASYKSHVRIWNTNTGELVKILYAIPKNLYMDKGYTYPGAKTVSFSQDGRYVLAGCSNYTAICWDAKTGKEIQKYKKTRTTCTTCRIEAVFSPDGRYVATAYDDSVRIFDTKTGLLAKRLFSRSGSMEQIKFSRNGQLIGIVQYNHVYIWNFHKSALVLDLYDKQKQIKDFDFSADGTKIITGGGNRMSDIWEIKTQKHIATLKGYLNDFDERLLNHSYMYWAALINETCLSPDGKYIAVGRTGNNAKIIDFRNGRIHKTLRGHRRMVVSLDFSNDGKLLATGGTDGRAIVWNVESGDSVHVFKYRSPTEIIFSLDISNDGKWLATSDFGGYITIWSLETGKAVRSINAHQGYGSFSIKFGPNGIYILSAGLDRKLKLIELDTGEDIRTFIGHTDLISSINFHPNKKWFITAGWDNTVRVWDFYNGMQVKKINAHEGGVYDAKFDTSGNYIISGGDDYLTHLWDARTNTRLNTFKGHKGGVGAVNITPDNRFIITGSRDGSIKIWNRELNREIVSRIFINENDWFIRSPEGYFDASQGAFKSISFVKGTQSYSIDQFFNKFYVPGLYIDLLMNTNKRITTSIQQEMEKFPPSSVEIISPEPGKHFDNNNVIFLTKIMNNGGGVSDLKVLHNGKRLPVNIDDVKKMKKAGQYAMKTFDVSLIPGENVITVSAFNNGMIESTQQNITLHHAGTPKLSKCYVVSVGINKYENPSLNLNYAKPDAQAISSLIDKKGNQLFKEVKTFEFYDSKATKENIFNALDEISNKLQPEDVFIFYFAGHGSMINNYFYFITTESTGLYQEDKLESAIHVTELQNRLKKLPALKQVVIMDACHSGTSVDLLAMRGASEEKALAQLSRSSGIHVLASTGKQQQAAETGMLGHGIFTYVLLEALMGKADGAPKDSKVTVYELKSYLDDQVPEVSYRLLGHKQYPNTFSIGHDFPLIFEIE